MSETSFVTEVLDDNKIRIETFKIKNCPCCSSEAMFIVIYEKDMISHGQIRCGDCSVGTVDIKDAKTIITDWNKRIK